MVIAEGLMLSSLAGEGRGWWMVAEAGLGIQYVTGYVTSVFSLKGTELWSGVSL